MSRKPLTITFTFDAELARETAESDRLREKNRLIRKKYPELNVESEDFLPDGFKETFDRVSVTAVKNATERLHRKESDDEQA